MRNLEIIENIIVHCTGSSENATVAAIVNYWRTVKKWKSGGYHILIDRRGIAYYYLKIGNSPYQYVDHLPTGFYLADVLRLTTNGVEGHNWNSVHISWIGGAEGVYINSFQKATLYNEVVKMIDVLPNKNLMLYGHRDFSKDKNGDGIISPADWTKLCPYMELIEWANATGAYNYLLKTRKR
jgi:N-acetylmuramoyl-L-alanine amidase